MMHYNDLAMRGKMSTGKKYVLVFFLVVVIVGVGVLTAFLIDRHKEFLRNNLGTFEISLSNSGTEVTGGVTSVEFTKLKIGQKERLKLGLKLSSCTRKTDYTPPDDEGNTYPIENGVYAKLIITGEVFDIGNNGERIKNEDYCKKLANVLSSSCYAMNKWEKFKNEFTFCASSTPYDNMKICEGQEYFSNADIVIYFNNNIVDGSWYEKIIVLNFDVVAVDSQSIEATSWKLSN